MGVLDGSAVSAAITNPAFINKNQDDTMANKLAFARALSGASIADIQQAINNIYSATGVSESNTGTVYNATAGTITNGQSYQSSFTVLANKFDAATGHMHTGAAGDGPILDVVLSASVTGGTPSSGDMVFIPGTGITINQSGPEFTFSSTAVSGVTSIAASGNTPITGAAVLVPGTGITLSEAGQNITITSTAVGGGTKNYLGTVNGVNGNGNFELGTTTKWSLFNTTLTGVIPTGSITAGAASITTFSTTSSSPLAGVYSLNIASSGAITAGQGFISDAFTLDIEDMARPITESFFYEVLSGATNLDFSGTSSNTWAVYLYNVTDSLWVQPGGGVYNLVQNSGAGFSNGTFQTSSNGTQYRLAVICVNASLGASSMLFDDFFFGPQPVITGVPATDWDSYTPVLNSNTGVSVNTAKWRRIGDTVYVQGKLTYNGTGSSSSLTVSVPTGLSIDSSKLGSSSSDKQTLGNGLSNLATLEVASAVWDSGNNIAFYKNNTSGLLQSSTFTASAEFTYEFFSPIQGWSSNVQMSNDTSTRVIAARTNSTPTSASFNNVDYIKFPTMLYDLTSSYSSSTGLYTVPVSGVYSFSGQFGITGGAAGFLDFNIYKNGSSVNTANPSNISGTEQFAFLNYNIELIAGDTIGFRWSTDKSSAAISGGSTKNYLNISRISGPATIASTETVGMSAYKSGGNQTASSSYQTVSSYTSTQVDTHGQFNSSTGIYTIPISGLYSLSGNIAFAANSTGIRLGRILKNTASIGIGAEASNLSTSDSITFSLYGLINCIAGDQINLQAFQNSGGSLGYVTDTDIVTRFDIARVGN